VNRVIAVVIAGVAAFAGWHYYTAAYAPVQTYKEFAEHMLHGRYDKASEMADGLSADDLQKLGTQEKIGAGPPMFQTIFPSVFTIETEDKDADGTLTLHATQLVQFNPAGIESAVRPAMFAKMKQTTRMQRKSGAWKITAFENKFDSMGSVGGR
jgi:hypothetical protein